MTHEEFRDLLKHAMGGKIPISARETWGPFLKTRGIEFFMRWEWIKNDSFLPWAYSNPDMDYVYYTGGGLIKILSLGRVGHDK